MTSATLTNTGEALDSLSTKQVSLLLRTLRRHTRLLEASHHDARRRMATGKHPAYLIDYQLVWRYMYEEESHRERVLELEYLFSCLDVQFLIGLGTQMEILANLAKSTGLDPTSPRFRQAGSLREYCQESSSPQQADAEQSLSNLLLKSPRDVQALTRLRDLLERPNMRSVVDTMPGVDRYDQGTYDLARAVLDAARPNLTDNNAADAINLGQVVALRKSDFEYFPFLLTEATFLLDDTRFAGDPMGPDYDLKTDVCRTPLTAIYSRVAAHTHPAPSEIVKHTSGLTYAAAKLRYDLEMSRGYQETVAERTNQEWQALVRDNRLPAVFMEHLAELSRFVEDPLVTETQRIYDNLATTRMNWASQRGDVKSVASPRRLFDLILNVTRTFEARQQGKSGFDETWKAAVRFESTKRASFTLCTFRDHRSIAANPYLEAEVHAKHYVCRWAAEGELERTISAFSGVLMKRGVSQAVLQVGFHEDVVEFDAILPLTVGELIAEFETPAAWIRLNSPVFDLYADVLCSPEVTPVVGVIARNLNRDDIADLFQITSSRFLFHAWVLQALEHVASVHDH